MSARLVPFARSSSPSAPLILAVAPRLLPFLTRQKFASQTIDREAEAYAQWVLRKWALPPGATMEEAPCMDLMLCTIVEHSLRWRRRKLHVGETVLRVAPPHPMWRIACWLGRGVDRFLGGLQTALLIYYTLLGRRLRAVRRWHRPAWEI